MNLSETAPPIQRYAACIEYCGVSYSGWQRQKNAPSVQQAVEQAISKVANHPVVVTTAGRTDTGVHGIGQVVHFDSPSQREEYNWLRGINTALPKDISLIWCKSVPQEFHARFGARQRSYRYVILNRAVRPSYLAGRVTWFRHSMDLVKMQSAAGSLLGTHDFSAFRAAGCQSKNPVKDLRQLNVSHHEDWFWFDVIADGFLHHMVRNLVGVLCQIGTGDQPTDWARQVLESADRTQGGITFPPDGLYFAKVEYDEKYRLPPPPAICRFW
ncbi:MAG: tRNA pseudouridine(38-40) synthase TruA [Acidiferrobacterales bacterium]|nr:tRNA pseudouridine(38-40) synthase TruA [Acidiferrobacterales bacterium]